MTGNIPMKLIFTESAKRVCENAKRMAKEGLTIGTGGNVSTRILGTELIAITPSGISYNQMTFEDIIIVDLNGNTIEGNHLPSFETPMHTLMYREISFVNAVIHTHSQYATAFSVIREPIPLVCNEGLGVRATKVEVAEYHIPGVLELGLAALDTLKRQPESTAVLLANHGLLALGGNLDQAYSIAQNVEWEAKIYYLARSIGKPVAISQDQLDQVKQHYTAFHQINKSSN